MPFLVNQEEFAKISPQDSIKKAYSKTEEEIIRRAQTEKYVVLIKFRRLLILKTSITG